jgi:predicted dehydrogenase
VARHYNHEITYFLDCIASKSKPTTVTLADAVRSVAIVEHEQRSIDTGQLVAVSL